jgi:hypothetical protein
MSTNSSVKIANKNVLKNWRGLLCEKKPKREMARRDVTIPNEAKPHLNSASVVFLNINPLAIIA